MCANVPTISICIPAYNAEKFVTTTIESCLFQTVKPIEILLSDDKSSDNTRNVLEKFNGEERIRIVSNSAKLGIGAHYSYLLHEAKGSHVVFLSSDDALHPNFIKNATEILMQHWALAMLVFSGFLCDKHMKPRKRFGLGYPSGEICPPKGGLDFIAGCKYLISFTVWNVDSLKRIPKLPDEMGLATDWYWAIVTGFNSKLMYSKTPMGYYRYHENNASHSDSQRWKYQAKMMLEFLLREVPVDDVSQQSLIKRSNQILNDTESQTSNIFAKSVNYCKEMVCCLLAKFYIYHPPYLR